MEIITRQAKFTLKLFGALIARYYLAVLGGIALSLITVFLSPHFINFLKHRQKVEHIAVIGRFTQTDIPIAIQKQISIGLTSLTADGSVVPGLAKSWEIRDMGKTYVFNIDNSKTWHDKTLIDSSDIKYNFRDVSLEYPDSAHLIIRSKESFSPLLVAVSRPAFKKGLVGAGAYKVSKMTKNGQLLESLELSPFDGNLAKIVYHFYASSEQAKTAFKLGVVHTLRDLNSPDEFVKWPNVRIETQVRFDQYLGLFLNTNQLDKNLRLALAYSIDKSRWGNRSFSPVAPTSWANTEDIKKYDLDLTRAKQLLKKAEKIPDKIVIQTPLIYQPLAASIQSDWQTLGLKVETVIINTLPETYQVLLTLQDIPTDPDQYNLWHSSRTTNLSHLDNKRIDRLLELGRTQFDQTARRQIYQDFQKFLLEEIPTIFLFHPTTYSINRN